MKTIKTIKTRTLAAILTLCLMAGAVSTMTATALAAETQNPYGYWQSFSCGGKQYKTVTCTWFAWQQAYDNLGISLPVFGDGYARSWLENAAKCGYQTGTEPRASSIACWNAKYPGDWGHVAYVTAVNGNSITYNEGGSADRRRQDTVNGIYYGHTLPDGYTAQPDGYIYLDNSSSNSSSQTVSINFGSNFYAYISSKLNEETGIILLSNTSTDDSQNAATAQWDFDLYNPRYIWHFMWDSSVSAYKIISEYDGRCLDVCNAGSFDGANIWVYSDNGTPAQRWKLVSAPENQSTYFNMVPNSSEQGLAADITNADTKPGTNVQLWTANATKAQQWAVRKVTFNYAKPSRPSTPTGIRYVTADGTTTISWNAVRSSGSLDRRAYAVIIDGVSYTTNDTSMSLPLSEGAHFVKIRAANTAYLNWTSGYAVETITVTQPYYDFSKDLVTGWIPEPD